MKAMLRQLYAITEPVYTCSHNAGLCVNGVLESKCRVPWVACEECDSAFDDTALVSELPSEMASAVTKAMARKKPLFSLVKSLVMKIGKQRLSDNTLSRRIGYGASFPPWHWRVPVTPDVRGLYWEGTNFWCGDVAKACLDSVADGCIRYCPVELMQAGTLTFPFKQKIPFTDDIDRLMCVSDDYDDPTSVGRFWLMKPTNDTFVDFINGFIVDVCDSCGRDILDSDRLKTAAIKCATIADRCELPLEWTPDVPVFVSHVYGGAFIVTPETYEKIRKADVVNYDAKVVTVV